MNNMQLHMKKHFSIIGSVLFFVLWVSLVEAGIAVAPTMTEMSLKPGQVYEGLYKVENRGQEDVLVTIETVDWLHYYLGRPSTLQVDTWLHFEETEFTLGPGRIKDVAFKAHVPQGMKSEQTAQIFFAYRIPGQEGGIRTRLGVIYYLGVKGKERIRAKIESVGYKFLEQSDGNYEGIFNIKVNNKGTIHIRPSGVIRLYRYGDEAACIPFKRKKGIYAAITDMITVREKNLQLKKGKYKYKIELDCSMYDIDKKIKKKGTIKI